MHTPTLHRWRPAVPVLFFALVAALVPLGAHAFEVDDGFDQWQRPEWRKAKGIRSLSTWRTFKGAPRRTSYEEFDREGRRILSETDYGDSRLERDADGQIVVGEVNGFVTGIFRSETINLPEERVRFRVERNPLGFVHELVREQLAADGTVNSRQYMSVTAKDVIDPREVNATNSKLHTEENFAVDGLVRSTYGYDGELIRVDVVENGRPTQGTRIKDGVQTAELRYLYDERGNHIETVVTTTAGETRQRTVYEYDDEGRPRTRRESDGDEYRYYWVKFGEEDKAPPEARPPAVPDVEINVADYFDVPALGAAVGVREVKIDKEHWFVDENGKKLSRRGLRSLQEFTDGISRFQVKSLTGLLSRDGRIIVQPSFEEVGVFAEGRAPFRRGARWGVLDNNGREVLAPTYSYIKRAYSGGAIPFADGAWVTFPSDVKGGRWGLLDRAGDVVVKAEWDAVSGWGDGRAFGKRGDRWHLVSAEGAVGYVSPPGAEVTAFGDGRALVMTPGNAVYIDVDGQQRLGPYGWGSPFQEERAIIATEGRCQIIAPDGRVVADIGNAGDVMNPRVSLFGTKLGPCVYLKSYSEGLAAAQANDGSWILLTRDAQRLPGEYPSELHFKDGVARYLKDDVWHYVVHPAPQLIPPKVAPPEHLAINSSATTTTAPTPPVAPAPPDSPDDPDAEPDGGSESESESEFDWGGLFDFDDLLGEADDGDPSVRLHIDLGVAVGVDTNPYRTNPIASGDTTGDVDASYLVPHGTLEVPVGVGVGMGSRRNEYRDGDPFGFDVRLAGSWRGWLGPDDAPLATGSTSSQLLDLELALETSAFFDLEVLRIELENTARWSLGPERFFLLDAAIPVPFFTAPYGSMNQQLTDVGSATGSLALEGIHAEAGYFLRAQRVIDAGVAGSMDAGTIFAPARWVAPGDWISLRRPAATTTLDFHQHEGQLMLGYSLEDLDLDGMMIGVRARAGAMLSGDRLAYPWEADVGLEGEFAEDLLLFAWVGYGSVTGASPPRLDLFNNLVLEAGYRSPGPVAQASRFVIRRRFLAVPTHSEVVVNEVVAQGSLQLGSLTLGLLLAAGLVQVGQELDPGGALSVASAEGQRADLSGVASFLAAYDLGFVTVTTRAGVDGLLSDGEVLDDRAVVPVAAPLDYLRATASFGVEF